MDGTLEIADKIWYRGLVPKGTKKSLMSVFTLDFMRDKLVVCLTTDKIGNLRPLEGKMLRAFAIFEDSQDFLETEKKFAEERRGFFEILFENKQRKIYFDIDLSYVKVSELFKVSKEDLERIGLELIQCLVDACFHVLEDLGVRLLIETQVLLFSSHSVDKSKVSYHLVIDGHCQTSPAESKKFLEAVLCYIVNTSQLPGRVYYTFIDKGVYGIKQQFRLLGAQKVGSGRKKIACPLIYRERFSSENSVFYPKLQGIEAFTQSLISYTKNCVNIPGMLNIFSPKTFRKREYSSISDDEANEAMARLSSSLGDYFTMREISGNKVFLDKRCRYNCPICSRMHESENPYLVIRDGTVYYKCRRNPLPSHRLGALESSRRDNGSLAGISKSSKVGADVSDHQPISHNLPMMSEDMLLTFASPFSTPKTKSLSSSLRHETRQVFRDTSLISSAESPITAVIGRDISIRSKASIGHERSSGSFDSRNTERLPELTRAFMETEAPLRSLTPPVNTVSPLTIRLAELQSFGKISPKFLDNTALYSTSDENDNNPTSLPGFAISPFRQSVKASRIETFTDYAAESSFSSLGLGKNPLSQRHFVSPEGNN